MSYVPLTEERKSIYRAYWSRMAVLNSRRTEAERTARRLLLNLDRYRHISHITNVPAAAIMVAHERESGGNWSTFLGNGQPLNRKTTMVPRGLGPWATWEAGAVEALQGYEHINSIEEIANYLECFNGQGYWLYHNHMPSPYLWGGTNIQKPGKYREEPGRKSWFDPTLMDPQMGGMAILKVLFDLEPSLADEIAHPIIPTGKSAPYAPTATIPMPAPRPVVPPPAPIPAPPAIPIAPAGSRPSVAVAGGLLVAVAGWAALQWEHVVTWIHHLFGG